MSFDYENLCKKMGYNPLNDDFPLDTSGDVLDDRPSPFTKLNSEELEFMEKYLLEHLDAVKNIKT